jgi:hypothetical protein
MREPEKALSLWQPWASLIVLGHKDKETRSWPTSYRGRLWIHATKGDGDGEGEYAARSGDIAIALALSNQRWFDA